MSQLIRNYFNNTGSKADNSRYDIGNWIEDEAYATGRKQRPFPYKNIFPTINPSYTIVKGDYQLKRSRLPNNQRARIELQSKYNLPSSNPKPQVQPTPEPSANETDQNINNKHSD